MQAYVVLDRENGSESPTRTHQNTDAAHSIDSGCLMINNYWHFGTDGWTQYDQIFNPEFNARIAYQIYKGRGWRSWYGAEGVYWK